MALKRIDRRLAAILAVDIAGYSRMMGAEESGTLDTLKEWYSGVFNPLVGEHGGRIVKLMGDGALVEFASVVDAVNCAVGIQERLPQFNEARDGGPQVKLRIGVNLGDVIIEGDDLFGDGVNVAARLQETAEPGEVVLSATAWEHAGGRIAAKFEDGGERVLKNIAKPVRIFRWPAKGGESAKTAGVAPA